ncbi:hypothetical protein HMPREF9371_1458 [Neisseria shayeganii 871]|uniref:Uncharacterized protein n=1 Tax=Neisseria shayeganii 871 TaxID=1032488 RepID=G4CIL9_9NEIS|nr:hypothetical protein HMPREF9371_1458 [Neisseria shayeganii 871]
MPLFSKSGDNPASFFKQSKDHLSAAFNESCFFPSQTAINAIENFTAAR